SLSERVDRGEPLDDVPEVLKQDLRAYWKATQALEVVAIEQFVVNDALQTAGTFDRLVKYKGRHYIADIKTGNVSFAAGSIAMQLAIYASAVEYSHDPVERKPLPEDVSQEAAVVIHLPQGEGKCELHWIDIER